MTNPSQSNNREAAAQSEADTQKEDRQKFLLEVIEAAASLSLPDEQFWTDPKWEILADKLEAIFPPRGTPDAEGSTSSSEE